MNKFLLSNIALVLGVLLLIAGINNPSTSTSAGDSIIAGVVVILGTLAYQSAKKRKLGLVKNTTLRKITEVIAIVITFLMIFLKNDILSLMYNHPFSNTLIPLWVWIAYFTVIFSKPRQIKE